MIQHKIAIKRLNQMVHMGMWILKYLLLQVTHRFLKEKYASCKPVSIHLYFEDKYSVFYKMICIQSFCLF